jgi:hypothetical protein
MNWKHALVGGSCFGDGITREQVTLDRIVIEV